jgi:phthalate 4,5-dioxygenase oxygenase subunit
VGCTYAAHITGSPEPNLEIERPDLWSVGQFMLPFYAMLPYGSLGSHWVVARVPMDDHHTLSIGMYCAGSAIPSEELMFGPAPARLPNGNGWFDRFRLARNPSNDFDLERQLARRTQGPVGVGAGIQGQAVQDACMTTGMGAIVDRTREHLGAGDAVIVRVRKRLLAAAYAFAEDGTVPPGIDLAGLYRMQQGTVRVRRGSTWQEELGSSRERASA